MIKLLIEKELKNIFASPKFVATFAVCTLLILLSVYIGIKEYQAGVAQYETARDLDKQALESETGWRGLETQVYRMPEPLFIFSSGIHFDVGRMSVVTDESGVKLRQSIYSDDPLFAVFRFVDFTFIVQVVLSLLAILFTYDAINGEREQGTLKLTFAQAVPKVHYILAKIIGSWLGLVVPLAIPMLLAVLLLYFFNIPMTHADWFSLGGLTGLALLYFSFFIVLGILVSALTRTSSVSFLSLLVLWIALVLIVPRASVMLAGQLVPTPSAAEIDGKLSAFSKDRWDEHLTKLEKRWQERLAPTEGMTEAEQETWRDENSWAWMKEDEAGRREVERAVNDYALKLREDVRNRKLQQQKLAFSLARFSPVSAFVLGALELAGTDIGMKARYEDTIERYRRDFLDYTIARADKSGDNAGNIMITVDTNIGVKIQASRDQGTLDVSGVPVFTAPKRQLLSVFNDVILDAGLLVLVIGLGIAGSFVAFLRYDVR